MELTRKTLKDGQEFEYENTKQDELTVWYEVSRRNWIHPFRMMYNGDVKTFKVFSSLRRNVNRLIDENNLIQTNE